MSCDFISVDGTIHVPAGCLCDEAIDIPCKGPDEKVLYVFSLKRRLRQTDTIISAKGTADDPSIRVQFVSCDEKTFTVLISGGQLGKKSALHFSVTTSLEEERTFTAALSIMPDGTVTDDKGCHYVILPGSAGKDATIKIGTVTSVPPTSPVKVTNSGNATDACFNFEIPKGAKGDTGPQGPQGVKGDTGSQGPQGVKGDAGLPGVSYDNNGTVDLNVKSIKSDGGNVATDGNGCLKANNGIITQNNILLKPWGINTNKTTNNSSLVLYNLTGDNEQSITLRVGANGNFVIGDWVKQRSFTTVIDYHLSVSGNVSIKGDLVANSLTSDNGAFQTDGLGGLKLNGGIVANNNILLRPSKVNGDKTTVNSSFVFYNLAGDNEQSVTLQMGPDGSFHIGDWVKQRSFTTIINYHLNVGGNVSVGGDISTSGNIATSTLKLADGLYLNSNNYAKLGVPTQIGCTKFCTDAYSTLNPQKNKGIIVVWNGTKWVDVLGADIATA